MQNRNNHAKSQKNGRYRWAFAALLALSLASQQACSPIGAAVGAGAAVGMAAYEERGVQGVAKDAALHAAISEKWFQADHRLPVKLGIEVYDGRALITGVVEDEAMHDRAIQLVWKVEGVLEVIDEIQVSNSGLADMAQDSWITAQLESKLTFDREILAVNYKIETVAGTIYLIGTAQNQVELDRVLAHARNIEHVRRVVSHVRLKPAQPAQS